jgi:hypothetical protein
MCQHLGIRAEACELQPLALLPERVVLAGLGLVLGEHLQGHPERRGRRSLVYLPVRPEHVDAPLLAGQHREADRLDAVVVGADQVVAGRGVEQPAQAPGDHV